jgi:hypothetical protein
MASYHQRPQDDDSDDEHNPFESSYDPNASTDRIPLTQDIAGRHGISQLSPSSVGAPAYEERPPSRYTLSETYGPPPVSSHSNLAPPGQVGFSFPPAGRPISVVSNLSEDWIQRQQPLQPAQADLRRYQTRRVRLNQGNQGHVFSADYLYCIV